MKAVRGEQAVVTIDKWESDLTGLMIAKIRVGDEVAISIRPEKIRLRQESDGGENCVQGVVTASTYIGSDTKIYLDVRGARMKVWEQNKTSRMEPSAFYRTGHKAWVSLDPENTLVLSRD